MPKRRQCEALLSFKLHALNDRSGRRPDAPPATSSAPSVAVPGRVEELAVLRLRPEGVVDQAACLINDSAGIPNPLCSFQAMAIVSGRVRLRTS